MTAVISAPSGAFHGEGDDYRYFFGTDRTQPQAIIPFTGPPALVPYRVESMFAA